MANVYLFPFGDREYRANISETSNDSAAIFMAEEGNYPVDVWWTRHDMNLDRLWATEACENREELIKLLNFLGECGHVVEELWEYKDSESTNDELSHLFDVCYDRKMEQLSAAVDEMLEDYEEDADGSDGILIISDEDDENFPF